MKKRVIAFMLGICMMATMTGCGNGEISNDKITIKQYKGLEIEKPVAMEVTDEQVNESIQSTLEAMFGEKKSVTDRPVQTGDTVTMDYLGKVDGVEFEGGKAEGANLEIGSGQFIPGFEDALIGHTVGETFDIDVTFPDGYSEELSGKAAVFTITLHAIEEMIVPELTEDLLPELSETAKTIDEYKAEVKKDLEKSNAETIKSQKEQLVWAELIDNCVIDTYPEDKMEDVLANIDSQFSYIASMNGMEVDDLVKAYYGITSKQMAHNLIKQEFAVELIAEKEKLTLTEEDYEKGLKEYAEQYGYDNVEEFEEMVTRDELEKMLLQKRVGDWLIENCVEVEKTEKE